MCFNFEILVLNIIQFGFVGDFKMDLICDFPWNYIIQFTCYRVVTIKKEEDEDGIFRF